MSATEAVDLVVNAGGMSRRMGRIKALLPVPQDATDTTPLILHMMQRLLPLVTGQVIVVTNDAQVAAVVHKTYDASVVPDQWADGGALGGVATGLAQCRGWAMVVACDMPLVSPAIFAKLLAFADTNTTEYAIIPRVDGQAQPFHGLWHSNALPTLTAQLAAGELAVQRALALLPLRWVEAHALGLDAGEMAFLNVNTPAEWDEFLAIVGEQNGPLTK